jgi:hypothetical protein
LRKRREKESEDSYRIYRSTKDVWYYIINEAIESRGKLWKGSNINYTLITALKMYTKAQDQE